MKSLLVCNTGSDSISKINIENLSVENLSLKMGEKPIGPKGTYINENKIYVANNYNNSISIIDKDTLVELDNFYVGPYPNDLVYFENRLYIACGEADAVIVYDLGERKTIYKLPTGIWPYNIDVDSDKGIIIVSNLRGNSFNIIDARRNKEIKSIETLEYPTKIKISRDKSKLYVCESYMGDKSSGYIEIFSMDDFESLDRIEVGKVPMDIWDDGEFLYVSNFNDGTVSIVDIKLGREIEIINVGGMPSGIVKDNNILYVCDYLRGRVISFDLNSKLTKAIVVGVEPNTMAIC